jgi:FkbM family methyltransferase
MINMILRVIKRYISSKKQVFFGSFELSLPSGHKLPVYLNVHKKYDQFLPFLISFFGENEIVIDVGANCGDTVAAMAISNSKLRYVCIEPDTSFFEFLEKNTKAIKSQLPEVKIKNLKCFVGSEVDSVLLDGIGGTKHAVLSKDIAAIKSISLDEIVKDKLKGFCLNEGIRLIKSDVDGFDWDVLNSGKELIAKDLPMLYFECQFDNLNQKNKYSELISYLNNNNYCWFVMFDNFGQVILRTSDTLIIENLFDYLWSQNVGGSTRTVYYYDILAYTNKNHEFIDDVLSKY